MVERLKKEFPGLTQSVFTPLLQQVNGNVDQAIKMLRDPVNEERDRSRELSEEQKIGVMKVVLGEEWAKKDRELLVALRQARGDLDSAVGMLYVQPVLPPPHPTTPPVTSPPAPKPLPVHPAPQPVTPPPPPPKPLDDKTLETAAKMEQLRIIERQKRELEALEARKQQSKATIVAAAAVTPVITASRLPEEVKVQKAAMERKVAEAEAREKEHAIKEKLLEGQVEHLARQLQEAEARITSAYGEVKKAQDEHKDVLEKDALARQAAMAAEKAKLVADLEDARKQMEAHAEEQRARFAAQEKEARELAAELARAEEEKRRLESNITCNIEARVGEEPGSVVVSWNIKGLPLCSGDWIGLFVRNRQYANKYTDYKSTEGKPTGSITFTGLKNGFYDARFFLDGKKDRDFHRSLPVLVGPEVRVTAALEYVPEERRRCIRVSWDDTDKTHPANPKDWIGVFMAGTFSNKRYLDSKYIGSTLPSTGVLFPAPRTVGEFEYRYFRADSGYISSSVPAVVSVPAQDSLTITPSDTVLPGSTINVHWECHSHEPSKWDWVGIFTPSAPGTAYLRSAYCIQYQVDPTTNSYTAGDVTFDLGGVKPLAPGKYEVRYFSSAVSKYVHQPFTATFTISLPSMSSK